MLESGAVELGDVFKSCELFHVDPFLAEVTGRARVENLGGRLSDASIKRGGSMSGLAQST